MPVPSAHSDDVVAALGAYIRQTTGSLLPLFYGLAAFQPLAAAAYARFATVETIRLA